MLGTPRVVVVCGSPGSGKDVLIRAVGDLGAAHAAIVPKHTSRSRRNDDGSEMICPSDPGFDLVGCDVRYANYGDRYGIQSGAIWSGLQRRVTQVVVVSNIVAMNGLLRLFGDLILFVYIHSSLTPKEYLALQSRHGDSGYARRRAAAYRKALLLYLDNFELFDHVLLHSGSDEDLYDQIFRLFRAYERGDL